MEETSAMLHKLVISSFEQIAFMLDSVKQTNQIAELAHSCLGRVDALRSFV